MIQDNNDDIIELTQVVADASPEDTGAEIIELTEVAADDRVLPETDLPGQGDLDMTVTESPDDSREQGGPTMPEISREELEAALERVIERKFSQTIETVLFEVMEKVLKKEITDIKQALQKDLDDIDKT
ncbi:MAG: hypothetical protein V6Z89_21555 [Desulfobacter sp.]